MAEKKELSSDIKLMAARQIAMFLNNNMSRASLSGRLGKSYYSPNTGTARRDIYEALGYLKNIEFEDYYNRFTRQDIAKRIIRAPVEATWRLHPKVIEVETENGQPIKRSDDKGLTDFEQEWNKLNRDLGIIHYLSRGDLLSGIGRYSIVLLGFNDGKSLHEPVEKSDNMKLIYLMPYKEDNAKIGVWNVDPTSEDYGMPEMYRITMKNFNRAGGSTSVNVHASRIVHIAENCLEDDVYGTPRLQAIFNRLQDLDQLAGGSSEMFWRGAYPGMSFGIKEGADINKIDANELTNSIDTYMHGMVRYLKLQGVDAKTLDVQVESPKEHIEVQLMLIAASEGIPQRILTGSERGKLASSQDETNWNTTIDSRRTNYATPKILSPTIDRLIKVGVLPEVEYFVEWPTLFSPGEKEKAQISEVKTKALKAYTDSLGADEVIPPRIFLRDFLNLSDDAIKDIEETLKNSIGESQGTEGIEEDE